jgi:hypothetical protein
VEKELKKEREENRILKQRLIAGKEETEQRRRPPRPYGGSIKVLQG